MAKDATALQTLIDLNLFFIVASSDFPWKRSANCLSFPAVRAVPANQQLTSRSGKNALERKLLLLLEQKKVLEQMVRECPCNSVASCQVLESLRKCIDFPSSNEAFGGQNNP